MRFLLILFSLSIINLSHCNIIPLEPHLLMESYNTHNIRHRTSSPELKTRSDPKPINIKASQIIPKSSQLRCLSSLASVYGLQALLTTASFCSVAALFQYIQYYLDISCNDPFALLFGLVTVLVGGLYSHKLSEVAIYSSLSKLSSRFKTLWYTKLLVYPNTNYIPVAKIGDKRRLVTFKPTRIEVIGCSFSTLIAFYSLGGGLHSFSPSSLSHPGAFSVLKIASLADGPKYASAKQKGSVQVAGKLYGCHSCGNRRASSYISDHQPPNAIVARYNDQLVPRLLHKIGLTWSPPQQYFYPHCKECSQKQAKAMQTRRRVLVTHTTELRGYHLCAISYLLSRALLQTRWHLLYRT